MNIKPFPFELIPKVSSQEASLIEALDLFTPSKQLIPWIDKVIAHEIRSSFSCQQEQARPVEMAAFLRSSPSKGVYFILGMEPVPQKAVLELDPFLARLMIDRLLGGSATLSAADLTEPLSEVDEGVLSYLMLKVLAGIFEQSGKSSRVHYRLDDIQSSPEKILQSISPHDRGILISFRVTVGEKAGYARFVLPDPLIQKAICDPTQKKNPMKSFSRVESFQTEVWAEVGRSLLREKDLQELEPGDVVLLQETMAHVETGKIEGTLPIRVGYGKHGMIRGRIVDHDNPLLRLEIDGIEAELPVGRGIS